MFPSQSGGQGALRPAIAANWRGCVDSSSVYFRRRLPNISRFDDQGTLMEERAYSSATIYRVRRSVRSVMTGPADVSA